MKLIVILSEYCRRVYVTFLNRISFANLNTTKNNCNNSIFILKDKSPENEAFILFGYTIVHHPVNPLIAMLTSGS